RPVRVGNGAYSQFQLDIYGEILDSAHVYRRFGGEMDEKYWQYLQRVVDFVIEHWREPDEGIWETRGGRRHFVFSKVMCWVALDRAIKAAGRSTCPATSRSGAPCGRRSRLMCYRKDSTLSAASSSSTTGAKR